MFIVKVFFFFYFYCTFEILQNVKKGERGVLIRRGGGFYISEAYHKYLFQRNNNF